MSNSRLQVTDLDFDQIKENLKTFLRSQSEFQDYDFDGAGLSILLDVLAYNTHYNAYYLNMVANESFLDTAIIRDSVVSHAKTLGYTPYSIKAPVASINVTVNTATNDPGVLTLPRGFQFISEQIDNTTYNFVTLDEVSATKANSQYFFEYLKIYQGELVNYNFVHNDSTNPKQVFVLPDVNIDTSTLIVSSIPSVSNNEVTVYTQVEDVLDVEKDSNVFYLQEREKGKYEIYFGNDIIGKKLPDGTVVTVSYLITAGAVANRANNFVIGSTLIDSSADVFTNAIVDPIDPAAGGSDRETIDEIKFNSTSQFATQNRLVTFKDYESYIKKAYPSVDSLTVWGGEDEIPPVYGKVYISLKPKENFFITELEKQRIIKEIIEPKAIVTVSSEIRDPEYLFLLVRNRIRFAKRKTTLTQDSLRSLVRGAILNYSDVNLNKFNATFVQSSLQDDIAAVDRNSIVGSEVVLSVQKRFKPELGRARTYDINFNTSLRRGTITDGLVSSQFDVFDRLGARRTVRIEEIPNSFTGLTQIDITDAGSGYITPPTVTITGDGLGATAVARIVNGRVEGIQITNRGIGYTRALVTITGGSGFGATAIAVLDARFGKLRTFYNDENANKQVVNSELGTIDYDTGRVVLSNLSVVSVNAADGLIRLTIQSDKSIISSVKNTLIAIDENDPSSISTDIIEE
jgi:hypothetical protein